MVVWRGRTLLTRVVIKTRRLNGRTAGYYYYYYRIYHRRLFPGAYTPTSSADDNKQIYTYINRFGHPDRASRRGTAAIKPGAGSWRINQIRFSAGPFVSLKKNNDVSRASVFRTRRARSVIVGPPESRTKNRIERLF